MLVFPDGSQRGTLGGGCVEAEVKQRALRVLNHGGKTEVLTFTLDDDYCIDGDVRSNIARLINHSCDPNCEAIIEDDRIWIYALKNIQPGTELAYDYKFERTGDNIKKLEKFYVCHCGAAKCRGSIMVPPKRRKKRKAKR